MIAAFLKPEPLWKRFARSRKPRIVAIFSFRYDHHLVGDLIANVEPMVDGWVSFDDRKSNEAFSPEPQRRRQLLQAAAELGAGYILAMDPDERLEQRAAIRIRELAAMGSGRAWSFRLRELYAPDRYRIDGVWGRKRQFRLFPMFAPEELAGPELHGRWFPDRFQRGNTELNLYHLKMIAPQRRQARRDLYKHLDPEDHYQKLGYDYLADETGATFEVIPGGRHYLPRHVDDGGLWMPELPSAQAPGGLTSWVKR